MKPEEENETKDNSERLWNFRQTEPEIEDGQNSERKRKLSGEGNSPRSKKVKKNKNNAKAGKKDASGLAKRACDNKSFLKNIFSGGLQNSDTED